jgi:thiol:disulfide interchange protein
LRKSRSPIVAQTDGGTDRLPQHQVGRRFQMHIVMLTLTIAFVVCVLLLVAFGLFTMSPFAHHADRFHEPGQRQDSPRLD